MKLKINSIFTYTDSNPQHCIYIITKLKPEMYCNLYYYEKIRTNCI